MRHILFPLIRVLFSIALSITTKTPWGWEGGHGGQTGSHSSTSEAVVGRVTLQVACFSIFTSCKVNSSVWFMVITSSEGWCVCVNYHSRCRPVRWAQISFFQSTLCNFIWRTCVFRLLCLCSKLILLVGATPSYKKFFLFPTTSVGVSVNRSHPVPAKL